MSWTDTPPSQFALHSPRQEYEIQETFRNIGAWSRSRAVDVLQFGAVGDGITDDSGALQAAMTAMGPTQGCVIFPPGTYLISTTLVLPEGVSLIGSSREGCVILANRMATSMIQGEFTAHSAVNRQIGGRIEHLTINNTNRGEVGGVGLDLRQWTRMLVNNCQLINIETGIRMEGVASFNEIRDTVFTTLGVGLTIKNGANSNSVYGGQFSACSVTGVDVFGGPDEPVNHFNCFGTVFGSNGSCVRMEGDAVNTVQSIFLHGPRIEPNTDVLEFVNDADEVDVIKNVGISAAHASPGVVMAANDRGQRADWERIGQSVTSKISLTNGLKGSTWYRETSGAVTQIATILASPPATLGSLIDVQVIGIETATPANMYERRHRAYVHGATPTIGPNGTDDFPVLVANARIGAIGAADSVLNVVGNDLRCTVTGVAGKDIRWWIVARWLEADAA